MKCIAVLALSLLAGAAEWQSKKTTLLVKNCGIQDCVEPLFTPRFRVKVEDGTLPKPGQVLQCSPMRDGSLDCGNGLHIRITDILLQAQ